MITIKNLKTWEGREGHACQCSVYMPLGGEDKKPYKVGMFTDNADGHYDHCRYDIEPRHEKKFFAMLHQHPVFIKEMAKEKYKCDKQHGQHHARNQAMLTIVEDFELNQILKRKCRKVTIIRLKGDEEDSFRTVKTPYSAHVKKILQERHGDDLAEIVNERFVTPIDLSKVLTIAQVCARIGV